MTKIRITGLKDTLIQRAINWGKKQESINAMLLTGSRAAKGPIDELSDYDVAIFGNDFKPFLSSSFWMEEIKLYFEKPENKKSL